MSWRRRTAAIAEILGVFLIGSLLAATLGRAIGFASLKARTPEIAPNRPVDFLELSWAVGGDLLLRYSFILGVAFAIGWWYRRRRLVEYGVTTAGMSLGQHVRMGIVLFAWAALLPKLLILGSHYVDLGAGPAHWQLKNQQWTAAFWIFMAVSSFGLVPIIEELFARGYVQTRLTEDYGAPTAILITAVLFTFAHTQYFHVSVLSLGMLLAGLVGSLAGGYVRYHTGSLLPAIVAHALGNVPLRGLPELVVIAAMLAIVLLSTRRVLPAIRAIGRMLAAVDPRGALFAVVLFAVVLAAVLFARAWLPVIGVLLCAVALWLEAATRPRHSARILGAS